MNLNYELMKANWMTVTDCYSGTVSIKNGPRAMEYLPVSSREKKEMIRLAQGEVSLYEFRKRYAIYENLFKPTIDDVVGLMQKNPLKVAFGARDDSESPREVRELNIYGNLHNDGLKGLKWRLNFNQALYGRYGLLLDVATDPEGLHPRFIITEYPALKILDGESGDRVENGATALRWVLLDETGNEFIPETKTWQLRSRLRVLALDKNGDYYQAVLDGSQVLSDWGSFNLLEPGQNVVYPMFKGKRLKFIPFTVCNVNRLGIDNWQEPPFLDVANIAIGLYQVDSLYKKAIWNFASPTLSVANADKVDKDFFLGDAIWPRTSGEHPVTVSLLETSGAGLAEMRNAKDEMKQSLRYTSIRELLGGAGANSSGEAITLRATSGTAAIAAIDQTGSLALEEQLVFAAIWAGASSQEAADRISCRSDIGYFGNASPLNAVVSLMQHNATADNGGPLLSKKNLYSLLEKSVPNAFTSFEDNELQKLDSTCQTASESGTGMAGDCPN
ncbi:MAG: hypothetical protein Q4G68_06615 [Planctomycetia bacterium]|nr:hypothetical protein [Planctomycetia bacterium]